MTEQRLKENLHRAGFDIFHGPFSPKLYNDLLESEGLVQSGTLSKLPEERGRENESPSTQPTTTTKTKAYLIGNTKHLWPVFLEWLHTHEDARIVVDDNPLDTYERTVIEQQVVRTMMETACRSNNGDGITSTSSSTSSNDNNDDSSSSSCYELFYSSDLDPFRMVSMARVASCTGFSYLDPDTHLSIHPEYGTWHSYRAVLVLPCCNDDDYDYTSIANNVRPEWVSNPLSPQEARASKEAFDDALRITMMGSNSSDGNSDGDGDGDSHPQQNTTNNETTAVGDDNTSTDNTNADSTNVDSTNIGIGIDIDIDTDKLCRELGEGRYQNDDPEETEPLRKQD